jgi:UDP-N-acetyl-2-amino-2-deoxyglucuronate dehydrogenase
MGKIRIGIVGTSGWTEMMYLKPLSTHPEAEIVALCGTKPDKTAAVAACYGIARSYADYRQMLADGGLDAVAVVTPEISHHAIATAALRTGLHVCCEKPLAVDAAEAWDMVRIADETGRHSQIYFTWRWQPHYRYLKDLIDQGAIGRPRRAELTFRGGFVRDRAYHWRLDPRQAKGTIADLGAHMIDLGLWFFGPASSVTAQMATVVDRTGIPGHDLPAANDAATLLVRFASGVETVMDISAATPVGDRHMDHRVRVEGETGVIEIDHVFGGVEMGLRFRMALGTEGFRDVAVPDIYRSGDPRAESFDYYLTSHSGVRAFVSDLAAGRRPSPDFRQGALVQDIVDAAFTAAQEGRRVPLGS